MFSFFCSLIRRRESIFRQYASQGQRSPWIQGAAPDQPQQQQGLQGEYSTMPRYVVISAIVSIIIFVAIIPSDLRNISYSGRDNLKNADPEPAYLINKSPHLLPAPPFPFPAIVSVP